LERGGTERRVKGDTEQREEIQEDKKQTEESRTVDRIQ
jgi:hypothetical protein